MIKRRASGWYFWGVVVAVAFPGPYGPETGYDPRDNPSASTLVRFRRPQTCISPASFAAVLFARNEKLPSHYVVNRRSVSSVVACALQMTGLFCILEPAKMPFWISKNAHGVGGSQESFTRQESFRWEGISHLSFLSPSPSLSWC